VTFHLSYARKKFIADINAMPLSQNRRRFASVWRRAKARLTPQLLSASKPMRSIISGIGSVAPTRSFAKSPQQT
jgi:hypothetical protein